MLILTSYPKLQSPVNDSLNVDKLAHCFIYFVYGLLFLKMHGKQLTRKIFTRLLLLALIVPLLDEIHQIPIPGRSFSGWDILADLFGLSLVFLLYSKRFRPIQTSTD